MEPEPVLHIQYAIDYK